MFELHEKTALVTGASGGIGREIAALLHKRGARVVLHGTRREVLEEIAAELGAGAFVVSGSLADENHVKSLISEAEKAAGASIDILVNNAGVTRDGLFMRMKESDWDEVLNVNLRAAFILSRDAIKAMMKKRYGRIINITSVVAVTGNPGQGNYCASKAGLIGMSKSLALETASRNITVNCLAPGFIETAMTDALTDEQKKKILDRIPAGRMGSAGEIAAAALFLASAESAYINGQTLHVNGAMALV